MNTYFNIYFLLLLAGHYFISFSPERPFVFQDKRRISRLNHIDAHRGGRGGGGRWGEGGGGRWGEGGG